MKWVCLTKDFHLLVFAQATHPDAILLANADESIEMTTAQKIEVSPTLHNTLVVVPGLVLGAKESMTRDSLFVDFVEKGMTLVCPDAHSLQSW